MVVGPIGLTLDILDIAKLLTRLEHQFIITNRVQNPIFQIAQICLNNKKQALSVNQGDNLIEFMKLVISGGGICGLTVALAAKTAGITPIVIEQRPDILAHSFGGGIGLWPPSQMVFQQLGLLDKLQQVSGAMPSASYFNHKGQTLGVPSKDFSKKYRILCLQRVMLSKILYEECLKQGIEVRTGMTVSSAVSCKTSVSIELSSGEKILANALIGADGINSQVRNIIMREQNRPQIRPFHCGYAYFRAVVDLSKQKDYNSFHSNLHDYAFESWGEQKRFGYVPLKEPLTFWFVAIPINKYGLNEYQGSHTCSEEQKQWILQLFQHWKAPIDIRQLILQTPAETILRTDIRKIKGVTDFPWSSIHNNILIIGDAANATAPNIAQGAGLAIESAWDLISMVNFTDGSGVDKFMSKRRKRAETVQNMADLVARVGQLHRPYSDIRDLLMSTSTRVLRSLEERIFQQTVRYSLGGGGDSLHWMTSYNPGQGFIKNQQSTSCILSKVIGDQTFKRLPIKTQIFRSQIMGEGTANVSVKAGFGSKLFGLSDSIQNKNFGAYVDTYFNPKSNAVVQKWTRIFNEGQKGATLYSTKFRATPNFGSADLGLTLTESLGTDFLRDLIRFGYDIKIVEDRIFYSSVGLWFSNFKLPIPRFLLPTSQWTEEQTQNGWKFDGTINYPKILGGSTLFQYSGHFEPKERTEYLHKKVVIAGGSGFIGKTVARIFHKKGWHVTILSRSAQSIPDLPFAKIQKWNPSTQKEDQEEEISSLVQIIRGKDAVINLAGESPAGVRWTEAKKKRIVQSRLTSIDLLSAAINKLDQKGMVYLQSSAIGIYGSRKEEILYDNSPIGQDDNNFRIKCTKALESLTIEQYPKAVLLRIGHVLGSEGGMFPFLKMFSLLRGKKYGSGGQYLPWIHVEDVGSAMLHIIENSAKYKGKIVNIASPEHHTYDSFYKIMGQLHNRTPIFRIPEWVFKILLGELSSVLLESQRTQPQVLLDNGFKFEFQSLQKALTSRALL